MENNFLNKTCNGKERSMFSSEFLSFQDITSTAKFIERFHKLLLICQLFFQSLTMKGLQRGGMAEEDKYYVISCTIAVNYHKIIDHSEYGIENYKQIEHLMDPKNKHQPYVSISLHWWKKWWINNPLQRNHRIVFWKESDMSCSLTASPVNTRTNMLHVIKIRNHYYILNFYSLWFSAFLRNHE